MRRPRKRTSKIWSRYTCGSGGSSSHEQSFVVTYFLLEHSLDMNAWNNDRTTQLLWRDTMNSTRSRRFFLRTTWTSMRCVTRLRLISACVERKAWEETKQLFLEYPTGQAYSNTFYCVFESRCLALRVCIWCLMNSTGEGIHTHSDKGDCGEISIAQGSKLASEQIEVW